MKSWWILPVAENRLLLFYNRRKWDACARKFYDHGIYCRAIGVQR